MIELPLFMTLKWYFQYHAALFHCLLEKYELSFCHERMRRRNMPASRQFLLRDITGVHSPVFTSLPGDASEILEKLRAGHADPRLYGDKTFVSKDGNGYKFDKFSILLC
jgi:hypothetical protein